MGRRGYGISAFGIVACMRELKWIHAGTQPLCRSSKTRRVLTLDTCLLPTPPPRLYGRWCVEMGAGFIRVSCGFPRLCCSRGNGITHLQRTDRFLSESTTAAFLGGEDDLPPVRHSLYQTRMAARARRGKGCPLPRRLATTGIRQPSPTSSRGSGLTAPLTFGENVCQPRRFSVLQGPIPPRYPRG